MIRLFVKCHTELVEVCLAISIFDELRVTPDNKMTFICYTSLTYLLFLLYEFPYG